MPALRAPPAFCFEGVPTPASASPFFGVAGDGSGAPSVIDVPERKSAAAGGSRDASVSGMAPCCGVLRSFLTPQPASPGLAPLASSHRATPPAFASAPRPGLRRRVSVRPSLPHHASGPRSAATRQERASGTSFGLAEVTGSRCRLRSRRLKWNLFDARPLFHLTRRLSPAARGTYRFWPKPKQVRGNLLGWGTDRARTRTPMFCSRRFPHFPATAKWPAARGRESAAVAGGRSRHGRPGEPG